MDFTGGPFVTATPKLAAGTGSSVVVECCQVCENSKLVPVLFLGYLPPVNQMRTIGEPPREQPAYPAQWLYCQRCQLVQIGLIIDPAVLFPPEYPYTSGTTALDSKILSRLSRHGEGQLGGTFDRVDRGSG